MTKSCHNEKCLCDECKRKSHFYAFGRLYDHFLVEKNFAKYPVIQPADAPPACKEFIVIGNIHEGGEK